MPKGRPTMNPKNLSIRIRLSEDEAKMLNDCVIKTGNTRTEIILNGIKKLYFEEVKKMGILTMETKYNGAVPVDGTARASVARDIVTNNISAYLIEMDGATYEVSKTVFDAIVKKFNLHFDNNDYDE